MNPADPANGALRRISSGPPRGGLFDALIGVESSDWRWITTLNTVLVAGVAIGVVNSLALWGVPLESKDGMLRFLQFMFAGVFAALFAAAAVYFISQALHDVQKTPLGRFVPLVFGPALFASVFTIAGFLYVGFVGRSVNEAGREWGSSLSAWVLIGAIVYAAL